MINYTYKELYEQESIDKQLLIEFDDGAITNTELYYEKFELSESICSEMSLRFGGCESSCVKFRIRNTIGKLKGKWLEISQILAKQSEEPMKIGRYKVTADKTTSDKRYRDITAHDALYDVLNTDVSDWYSRIIFPISIKKLRDLFFDYLGIEQEEIELPNDYAHAYANESEVVVTGADVIRDICELNGCFGKIGRDGRFKYVYLSTDTEYEISKPDRESLDYEDYDVQNIDQIRIQQTEADFDYYYGEGENIYPVRMRVLQLGTSEEELEKLASNLHNLISGITYKPVNIKAKGNPCFETGDCISTLDYSGKKIVSFVLERKLTGIQALKDVYKADGTEVYEEETSDTSVAIYNTGKEIKNIYKNNFYSHVFTNSQPFTIDGTEQKVITFNIAATAKTDVIFLTTIPFEMNLDGYVCVEYYIDAALVKKDSVKTYFSKGYNVLTLSNYISMGENDRLNLSVKIRTEYTESDVRKHDAKILSFENYISTGIYTEQVIDTTVPTMTISANALKATLFAKGLAGAGNKWDGTINLTDAVPNFFAKSSAIFQKAITEAVSAVTQYPTTRGFVESIPAFAVGKRAVFSAPVDRPLFGYVIKHAIRSIENPTQWTFEEEHINTGDGKFALRTLYTYTSAEKSIDSGRMCSVTIKTDDKASIEGVSVNGE